MSFFKSFFKSAAPDPKPPQPAAKEPEVAENNQPVPELYSGMKVEVLSPNNNLLFVGVLKIHSGGVLEVCSETDAQLPIAGYQQKIKLRGFQKNSQAFTLNGMVSKSSPDFWRIENLKFLQSKDSRAFFRQNANVKAEISPDVRYRGKDTIACKIMDVSAGGARVLCRKEFNSGALFILHVTLLSEEEPFSMTCQVRHVEKKEEQADIEYGCQFVGLPEREQERLLQAIFALQRKILQSRRD